MKVYLLFSPNGEYDTYDFAGNVFSSKTKAECAIDKLYIERCPTTEEQEANIKYKHIWWRIYEYEVDKKKG